MNKDSIDRLPRARKDKLIIKELPDETLVYDLENDKAHCLNSTAALVWQHCDGDNSVNDIARLLAELTNSKADDAIVWLALEQLRKFELLEAGPLAPAHLAGLNRRQWVRNVGFAAIALPIIISIAAPTAEAQVSRFPDGSCCGNPNQCLSNNCIQGPCFPVTPASKVCAP